MNRAWFPYLVVIFLLALLAVLATLQYRWLGQISDAESVRLKERLEDDTHRFAADFNSEIQKVYFSFKLEAAEFEKNGVRALKKRYLFWKQQAIEPGLIKDIYFVRESKRNSLKKFDIEKEEFVPLAWPETLSAAVKSTESASVEARIEGDTLFIPVLENGPDFTQVVLKRKVGEPDSIQQERHVSVPAKYGLLMIELDREAIRDRLMPNLTAKYFPKDGGGSFEVSVTDKENKSVYSTGGFNFEDGDASAKLLSLSVNTFAFFSKNIGNPLVDEEVNAKSRVVFHESSSRKVVSAEDGEIVSVDVQEPGGNTEIEITNGEDVNQHGAWKLTVRHSSGSLERFISATRNRNLAISFGILGILAAGMVLIVVSAQRARAFANRQLDFVSSVSHEFRTPLAVIYSAGENISDGVVGSSGKLADYGNLIKREGRKLSAMVEQILEHAGASAGRTKYEFKPTEISLLLNEVLDEYQPLVDENGFQLERDIAPGLPLVNADGGALRSLFQNLIANSLKYSNGKRWIGVTARNGGGKVDISVKDRGIGISPSDQKHIFEPFYRARDVVDEQISGNGLGLSLVAQIVEAHGGTISVESEIGEGTTFTLVLPAIEQQ